MESYSSALLKKSAFHDELVNVLNTMPADRVDDGVLTVQEYLKRRIAEIDKRHK